MHEHVLRRKIVKKRKTTALVFASLMAAMSVIVMAIGILIPTGKLGFMALGSLFITAAVVECGYKYALGAYAVSAILALIILPDKSLCMYYVLFFGYYPIVKSICEKMKNRKTGFIIKLCVFNAALTVMVLLLLEVLTVSFLTKLHGAALYIAIYIVFNIAFILYDIGLSRLIGLYMTKIHGKIK